LITADFSVHGSYSRLTQNYLLLKNNVQIIYIENANPIIGSQFLYFKYLSVIIKIFEAGEIMNSKRNIPAEKALWISPEGEIYNVEKTHIDMVFDYPERFGLTIKLIESVYNLYNEKYRIEGKAREEIIIMLIHNGWTRARRYHRPCRWTVNISAVDKKSRRNLKTFADFIISEGYPKDDEVLVDTPESRRIYTLEEIGNSESI